MSLRSPGVPQAKEPNSHARPQSPQLRASAIAWPTLGRASAFRSALSPASRSRSRSILARTAARKARRSSASGETGVADTPIA